MVGEVDFTVYLFVHLAIKLSLRNSTKREQIWHKTEASAVAGARMRMSIERGSVLDHCVHRAGKTTDQYFRY